VQTTRGMSGKQLSLPATFARLAGYRAWMWPVSVALLAIVSCLLWIPYLDVPLDVDAGGYATAAYWWARGDTLYEEFTITRPQGIMVVYRLIEAAGLGSVRGIHVVAAIYTSLSSLMLLVLASRVWGRGIGLGAAALFSVIMSLPNLVGYTANADLFMALPLLGSLYVLLRADPHPLNSPLGRWLLAGSGLLGAIALLIKPSGFAALLLAGLWILRRWRVEGGPWRVWLLAELALALGFIVGLAPAVLHGLLTAPEWYLDAVVFNRIGQDSAVAMGIGYQVHRFANNSAAILARLPLLLLAPLGFFALRQPADRWRHHLLGCWLLAAFAGAALGSNWYLHYYQQLLPPVAIATVLGVRALLVRSRRPWYAVGQGLLVVSVGALIMSIAQVQLLPADPARLVLDYTPERAASGALADYVRAHTAPDDRIYVAYDQAQIYYLAERRPAARWLYFRELLWTPGAFDEQVARIADPATAPRYIVGAQPFDDFGFDADGRLRAIVARDYVLETTIGGIPVYRRR
jgi:4-amino-4-deoxy-L-arabinose transferase-like glycosyltransferase